MRRLSPLSSDGKTSKSPDATRGLVKIVVVKKWQYSQNWWSKMVKTVREVVKTVRVVKIVREKIP